MRIARVRASYKDNHTKERISEVLDIGLFRCNELSKPFITFDSESFEESGRIVGESLNFVATKKKIDQIIKALKKVKRELEQTKAGD